MPEFDSPWEEALDYFLRQFLALFFPRIERRIDWSVLPESLDNELAQLFPDSATGKRFIDRLFKVRLLDHSELWLLIHIEVQTQREAEFAKRMFRYFALLDNKFQLPLTCLAVLADEHTNWRPNKYRYKQAGTGLLFTFSIVKLTDYRDRIDELEGSDNLFALIILAHLQSQSTTQPSDRLAWKQRIMRNLMQRKLDDDRRHKALRLVDWLLDVPLELNEVFWNEVREWKESKIMPFVTGLEKLLMKEGLEKGLEKGLKKGRKQGERAGLLSGLELALEFKFGKAGKKFFAELEMVTDISELRAVRQAISDGATVAELRKLL